MITASSLAEQQIFWSKPARGINRHYSLWLPGFLLHIYFQVLEWNRWENCVIVNTCLNGSASLSQCNFERAWKVEKLKKNVCLNFGAFRISTIIVVITIITNSCNEGLKEEELVMNHGALMTETVIDRATRAAIKLKPSQVNTRQEKHQSVYNSD